MCPGVGMVVRTSTDSNSLERRLDTGKVLDMDMTRSQRELGWVWMMD